MPGSKADRRSDEPPLPPGQQLAAAEKWPVVGERAPGPGDSTWTISITGLVEHQQTWTIDQLRQMPQDELYVDIHCVTRWSKRNVPFRGVRLARLLACVEVDPAARFISFVARSERNHSTSLPVADALRLNALIALECGDRPLPVEHGGPVRMVVPGRYFYKSVKWLQRVELLSDDRLGYWELAAGYHNQADPWQEQRYILPKISKQQAARLIQQRDFRRQDLLGIDAAGLDLTALKAEGARLRNANLQGCRLNGADFRGANLSNAHLQQADLRRACFVDADCEGANFSGADLRAADFTGASLFGASFTSAESESPEAAAMIDATTRISNEQIETLTPREANFMRAALIQPGHDF